MDSICAVITCKICSFDELICRYDLTTKEEYMSCPICNYYEEISIKHEEVFDEYITCKNTDGSYVYEKKIYNILNKKIKIDMDYELLLREWKDRVFTKLHDMNKEKTI